MTSASTDLKKCPRCNTEVRELVRIDAGMRLSLIESGHPKEAAQEVCTNCINELSKRVSQGAKLRAQRKAREANLTALFRNRISVLKQARVYLAQRVYAEAAIEYEKYLRILEIVFEAKPGTLNPESFKVGKKTAEIDSVLTVLWELLKIYDMNTSYQNKLKEKVELFLVFSKAAPGFSKMAAKIQAFAPKARNKEVFMDLLARTNAKRSRCFIATSAYESPTHPNVLALCNLRDHVLAETALGKGLISVYYYFSPSIAHFLDQYVFFKPYVRMALYPFVKLANKKFPLNN